MSNPAIGSAGSPNPQRNPLEAAIDQIVGVSKARVVQGDGGPPSEIHVVADAGRTPKQIIRDIQSVAATSGIAIDHRVVSIVQLENGTRVSSSPPPRMVLDSVVVASRADEGWVKVRVRFPNGETSEGTAPAPRSKEGRAKAAVASVIQALGPALRAMEAGVEIDDVMIYPTGTEELVWVTGDLIERRRATRVSGAAPIVDDTATAAAAATLHALNRLVSPEIPLDTRPTTTPPPGRVPRG